MPAIEDAAARQTGRGLRAHALLLLAFPVLVFLIHWQFLSLPYYWDELGQFVPAALDIYHDGAWVPHSTVPNAHAPGVMAYLALVWKIFGYSIPVTRAAMLLLAGLALFCAFLLALRLSPTLGRAPACTAALLLLLDPLFYMQSMLAQLDMPAMLCTLAALILFLDDRHALAALACTALVLAKETGVLLPILFGFVLLRDPSRSRYAAWYLAPILALGGWFLLLWRATGHVFGNTGFEQYNIDYALNPVRVAFSLLRRLYYLFFADLRWIGTLAIFAAWKNSRLYSSRAWKIAGLFLAAHVLLVSLLGGAELERYLLPVVPIVYLAMAAAWSTLRPLWRNLSLAATAAGLIAGLFVNPPYPFPFENNLALVDFVQLHRSAAQFLERTYPNRTIYTAWPLTQALRNPAFGYIHRKLTVEETSDLRASTLQALNPNGVDVLVLYSRTWEPDSRVFRAPLVQRFLARYYQYQRQMDSAEVRDHFGLLPVQRWTRRGQWVEIYARPALAP